MATDLRASSKLKSYGKYITTKLKFVIFNVAKYHLGKVKLELMQPASVPDQLRSVRQVNMSLCSQRFSPLGVRDLWGGLQGFFRGLWFIAQLL